MKCPRCNAPEMNKATGRLFIRAYKIMIDDQWESHCLHCGCWFNEVRQVTEVCKPECPCKEVNHAVG
jgi:hypothetical protein